MTMTIQPIPGQPGLFRRGLGDAMTDSKRATLEARVRQVEDELRQTRESIRPLLDLFPGALDAARVESAWDVLKRIPQPTLIDVSVRLSQETSVAIIKTVLRGAAENLDLARTMLGMPPLLAVTDEQFTRSNPRIVRLLDTTSAALSTLRQYIESAQSVADVPGRVARAVGLGIHPAVIVAGIVVAGVLLYALYSQIIAMFDANSSAIAACIADATAGHPCTGDQFISYQQRAQERSTQGGLLPSLQAAANKASNVATILAFGAGLLVLGALVYTAAPAVQTARSTLEVETRSAFDRLKRRTA